MQDWIKFNFNEHESEEEYLFAQEKLIARQDVKKIRMREWNAIWMMYGAKQRKGIENYQLLELRTIVKANGEEVQKDFVKKYRELKVESNRGKQAPCADTFLAKNRSILTQRTRKDSQGRNFYQDRRSRNDSIGRPFYRRYYRKDNDRHKSFSRDMRTVSRNSRNKSRDKRDGNRQERGRSTERRSEIRINNKQDMSCTGCTCENCEKMREAAKGLNVNWCEEFKENGKVQVSFTEKSNQVMILDLGAPVSLARNGWIKHYLEGHGLELKNLKSVRCHQKHTFGPSKQYISNLMVELPVLVRRLDGKEDILKVFTYLVDADVPFLCGKR